MPSAWAAALSVLLAALLGLEAAVTAVLNLDTAVVFLTPIALHRRAPARLRRAAAPLRHALHGERRLKLLFLPGSNLTNLIVLHHRHTSGAEFARTMALPWIVVVVLTIGFVAAVFRPKHEGGEPAEPPPLRLGAGALATAAATVLMLALGNPALPVLAVGS